MAVSGSGAPENPFLASIANLHYVDSDDIDFGGAGAVGNPLTATIKPGSRPHGISAAVRLSSAWTSASTGWVDWGGLGHELHVAIDKLRDAANTVLVCDIRASHFGAPGSPAFFVVQYGINLNGIIHASGFPIAIQGAGFLNPASLIYHHSQELYMPGLPPGNYDAKLVVQVNAVPSGGIYASDENCFAQLNVREQFLP